MESPKLNVGLLIASIALSIMLWLVVYPQNSPSLKQRSLAAKVSYVGLPPELVVTEYPSTLTVLATGTNNRLETIDEERIELVVSLASATPGRKRYQATITPSTYQQFFPTGEYVSFEIEEVATKSIDVTVEPQGQLDDPALAVDDFVSKPVQVVATGPKSQIESLKTARVLYDVRKIRLGESLSQFQSPDPILADGSVSETISFEPKLVEVMARIQTAPISKPTTLVAEVTGTVANGYVSAGIETSPNTVTIQGSSKIVNGINQLKTEPINIDGLTATKEYRVAVVIPRGVRIAGGLTTVRVRVIVNRDPDAAPTTPPAGTVSPPETTP